MPTIIFQQSGAAVFNPISSQLGALPNGPGTIVALVNGRSGIVGDVCGLTDGGGVIGGMSAWYHTINGTGSGTNELFDDDGLVGIPSPGTTPFVFGTWFLVAITWGSGTGVERFHWTSLSSVSWTHANSSSNNGGMRGSALGTSVGQWNIGNFRDNDSTDLAVGLVAAWAGVQLSDAQIQALLTSSKTSDWYNSAAGQPTLLIECTSLAPTDIGAHPSTFKTISPTSGTNQAQMTGGTPTGWTFDGKGTTPANLTLTAQAASQAAAPVGTPVTIFGNVTPATPDSGDASSYELGVKFQSDVPGKVIGIRFYKSAANTGIHIGNLWIGADSSATLMATATFSGETPSGWQTVYFASPVSIIAVQAYIASYFCPGGHYADLAHGIDNAIDAPPLHAIANSITANGVFTNSSVSTVPFNGFNAANYYVDLLFLPTPTGVTPANLTLTAGSASSAVPGLRVAPQLAPSTSPRASATAVATAAALLTGFLAGGAASAQAAVTTGSVTPAGILPSAASKAAAVPRVAAPALVALSASASAAAATSVGSANVPFLSISGGSLALAQALAAGPPGLSPLAASLAQAVPLLFVPGVLAPTALGSASTAVAMTATTLLSPTALTRASAVLSAQAAAVLILNARGASFVTPGVIALSAWFLTPEAATASSAAAFTVALLANELLTSITVEIASNRMTVDLEDPTTTVVLDSNRTTVDVS